MVFLHPRDRCRSILPGSPNSRSEPCGLTVSPVVDGGEQWGKGKSFDTFTPIGPWLVTSDSLPDPQATLGPGDLIITGTPAGVGMGMGPPSS